jgi:hypothetical protein
MHREVGKIVSIDWSYEEVISTYDQTQTQTKLHICVFALHRSLTYISEYNYNI